MSPRASWGGAEAFFDGSMFDNFDDRFTALGWAFVVVAEGAVVGLARGVPPQHVRSIPAAEAWALAMAVDRVDVSTSMFYTDCTTVKALAKGGKRRATSARQVNARVWNTMFLRTDERSLKVEWVPAHLGAS